MSTSQARDIAGVVFMPIFSKVKIDFFAMPIHVPQLPICKKRDLVDQILK
jgi:hypothetical protein